MRNLSVARFGDSSMNLGNLGRHTIAAPLAALTLVAGGGIALAASGGNPAPQAAEHRPVAVPTVSPTATPTDEPTEEPTDEPTPDASPSPSLTGLCKAARAGGYASSTKSGNVNPAWSALESAAGGADNVDSYCNDRLAADAAAKAARKGTDVDDVDGPKADNPGKDPKPAQAHRGDRDDTDHVDSDDAGEVDSDDDAKEADSDHAGDGGSHGGEHGRH